MQSAGSEVPTCYPLAGSRARVAGEALREAPVSPCASVRSEVSSTSGADDFADVAVAAVAVAAAAGGVVLGPSAVAVAVVAASSLEALG